MILHKFSLAKELLTTANRINIEVELLDLAEASNFINSVIERYNPWKTTGHLSIGQENSTKLKTEENEFTFSKLLPNEPAFIFFEQNTFNKDTVVCIKNAKQISQLMENSYGMEYFISNESMSYLISVNWYTIELSEQFNLTCILNDDK